MGLEKINHYVFDKYPFFKSTFKSKLKFQIGREYYLFNEFETANNILSKLKRKL